MAADTDDVQSLLEVSSAVDGRLSTMKDLPYLRWRYGSFDRYRAVRIDSAGRFMPRRRRDVVDVHLLRETVLPDPCANASWALSLGDLELL